MKKLVVALLAIISLSVVAPTTANAYYNCGMSAGRHNASTKLVYNSYEFGGRIYWIQERVCYYCGGK